MSTNGGRLELTLATLDTLGHERRRRILAIAAAWLAVPVVTTVLLSALLDTLLPLPVAGRCVLCVFCLAVAVACLAAYLCLSRRRPGREALAVLVEQARPQAGNCIINAVQFVADGNCSCTFIEALLAECPVSVTQVVPAELHSRKPLQWLIRILPVALLFWAALIAFSPRAMLTSLARIVAPFAAIAPHSDTVIVSVSPGTTALRRGQELVVTVVTAGRAASSASLEVTEKGAPSHTVTMTAETAQTTETTQTTETEETTHGTTFTAHTRPVFGTLRYRVHVGDATSEWFSAHVAPLPGLVRWEAAVAPPPHTGRKNYKLTHDMERMQVIPGSTMIFAGLATMPLTGIAILQVDKVIAQSAVNGRQFTVKADIDGNAQVKIQVTSAEGVSATQPLPISFELDKPPVIALVDTPTVITAPRGAEVPVAFNAKDDFGITRVGLERITPDYGKNEEVTTAAPQPADKLSFTGRFVVDTGSFNADFNADEDRTLRFRLWAEDNAPLPKRAFSPVIQVRFPDQESGIDARAKTVRQTEEGIGEVIKKQRLALKDTRKMADLATIGQPVSRKSLELTASEQGLVRELSVQLLENRAALGGLGDVLSSLVNLEMKQVVELFAGVLRAPASELKSLLPQCVKLQNTILASLTGMKESMPTEQLQQDKTDVFAALQKLIKLQKGNLKDTQDALAGAAIALDALLHNQDRAAQDILAFTNLCLRQSEQRTDDDFAAQLRKAFSILTAQEAYEQALEAADAIDGKDLKTALPAEKKALKSLMEALDLLNKWRVKNARDIINEATEVLANTRDKLGELEERQAQIAEVTRDQKNRGPLTDEVREKLAEMDKEQEKMADLVEQLANDLYQFPELPVCNELNSKMREVYEEVLQALDSENLPSVEIAVQKEDSLLDAIRNTKKRIEDVEMWLPDVPDHFIWNMESFDTDEFPEIPLVPLPDELEDIVGELLDQAESIDAQSQDTTGNNIVADAEMGWAIMDGPMPSFAAKGKTGNTRPNDNEMTGRSGAGREGQATGELVENHVSGYEGRKTHARRTQDQFQKGMVTEDENSTLDARATGGGKLGGESESIGMFGNAPRRDLHTAAHGTTPQQLRQEAEVLYASARLLYIGTGGLGEAARDLRAIENKPPDIRELGSLRRRVLRRLEDTQVELKGGAVLPMPVSAVMQTGGSAVDDSDLGKLADEYKTLLNDYYRSLDK